MSTRLRIHDYPREGMRRGTAVSSMQISGAVATGPRAAGMVDDCALTARDAMGMDWPAGTGRTPAPAGSGPWAATAGGGTTVATDAGEGAACGARASDTGAGKGAIEAVRVTATDVGELVTGAPGDVDGVVTAAGGAAAWVADAAVCGTLGADAKGGAACAIVTGLCGAGAGGGDWAVDGLED